MTYPPSNQEFLKKETFSCTKCGQCCRPLVLLSEEDITKIEELGITNFYEVDPLSEGPAKVLKQVKGICMFLKRQGDDFVCGIYHNRPTICKEYPFFSDVKLKDCRPKGWERWHKIEEIVQK
ncbi:TPA: YkgJ family cysteine cluster protein [Candidatus Woesearchaeota archaeon]|nr:YkgJ family cysteine cluster protein [Candidatus Woesearchaeota archaeon]